MVAVKTLSVPADTVLKCYPFQHTQMSKFMGDINMFKTYCKKIVWLCISYAFLIYDSIFIQF